MYPKLNYQALLNGEPIPYIICPKGQMYCNFFISGIKKCTLIPETELKLQPDSVYLKDDKKFIYINTKQMTERNITLYIKVDKSTKSVSNTA